jgi:hypothetical protein
MTETIKVLKDGRIEITRETIQIIDLKELQKEIDTLKTIKEPSDEEVLEVARQGLVHDYYASDVNHKIVQLEEEIEKWQSR